MDLQQQVNGFLDASKLQGSASKDPPNGIRQLLEKKEVRGAKRMPWCTLPLYLHPSRSSSLSGPVSHEHDG
jgi:hypothetical protein